MRAVHSEQFDTDGVYSTAAWLGLVWYDIECHRHRFAYLHDPVDPQCVVSRASPASPSLVCNPSSKQYPRGTMKNDSQYGWPEYKDFKHSAVGAVV